MNRPNPDELLGKLQREEEKRHRGRLKIFFGASAGVGKTYAMLLAARGRKQQGDDVVIGVVETHGRSETAALLEDLEQLPLANMLYRGHALQEFDLDAALQRRPQLVLVDELAHSNVPGARHLKRWQDVHELLDAGIDVYTTVNVQHLESLNDIVGQITQIRVFETVPDRVLDQADEVTLVDLPPEELLERLRHGKVYMPQQAEHAVRNFFRKGNLIALRELALRRTADRVDAQMREYRADRSIDRIWQARDRLVVCIGPGPEAPTLARAAARLATSLRSDWIAVYVETPQLQKLSDARRERTLAALKLAAELGAETVTLAGDDAVATLIGYAQARNASKLVAGASKHRGFARWLKRSFGERLAEHAGDLDLTLIRARESERSDRSEASDSGDRSGSSSQEEGIAPDWHDALNAAREQRSAPRGYAYAIAICAIITLLASQIRDHFDLTNLVMFYLIGVIYAAARIGRGPGVLLSFLSVAAFDFFFVPPRMSLSVSDTQYLLTFAGMLLTSLVISHLTSSLRREARVASKRERRTGAMYAMAGELGAALGVEQIVGIGMRHVSEVFRAKVAMLLPDSSDKVRQKVDPSDTSAAALLLDASTLDLDVGQWVYDQQKPAGHGTDTLPAAAALYLPLKAPMRTRGVLAVATRNAGELDVPEQKRMLDAFAAQIALALERVHYVEIARDALVSMESERLRNSLLSAISHDLRTPLTTIVGFASMLAEARGDTHSPANAELIAAIHDESLRMTSIVTNLLDMARLQAGGLRLNRQWSLLEETVGAALRACRRVLSGRPVEVRLPADLPFLQLDAVLMERLFSNLLENAAKYTPPGSKLVIGAESLDVDGKPFVRVYIDDNGPGLPANMEDRVFEKFTRGEKESAKPGIGLGLSICRAIVHAHGGTIGANNRLDASLPDPQVNGARFWFTLPVDAAPPVPSFSDEAEQDLVDLSPSDLKSPKPHLAP
jgi:two-component system, OmpR family, sensor histidine kinase KdpD